MFSYFLVPFEDHSQLVTNTLNSRFRLCLGLSYSGPFTTGKVSQWYLNCTLLQKVQKQTHRPRLIPSQVIYNWNFWDLSILYISFQGFRCLSTLDPLFIFQPTFLRKRYLYSPVLCRYPTYVCLQNHSLCPLTPVYRCTGDHRDTPPVPIEDSFFLT